MATILAETMMAGQLALLGRPAVIENLVQIAMPEAAINAIIAPLVFFPLRGWYEFSQNHLTATDDRG
jgi:hypothetical protein